MIPEELLALVHHEELTDEDRERIANDPIMKIAILAADPTNWDECHELVQDREGMPEADYWHGILHQIEGDRSNANYWFKRSGLEITGHSINEKQHAIIKYGLTRLGFVTR